jgi:hypothetical protein
MFPTKLWIQRGVASALALVLAAGIAGCSSKQEKALEQAKKQALATGQPQQVVSVDKDGTTTITVVQPPAAGQKDPTLVTTTAPPPAGAPKPSPSAPIVSAVQQPQAAAPDPQAAPAPAEVTIPAGTSLAVRVDQRISVKTSHAGDAFTGEIVEPIMGSDGNLLIPKLSRVKGVVAAAHKRGHFKGASLLELRLTSMSIDGKEYAVETRNLTQTKKGKGKRSAAFIGGGSGLGMLIGGLASGGTGLLIGGLAGGGAGTAVAGLTGNHNIDIPAESVVHFKLASDLVVQEGP